MIVWHSGGDIRLAEAGGGGGGVVGGWLPCRGQPWQQQQQLPVHFQQQ